MSNNFDSVFFKEEIFDEEEFEHQNLDLGGVLEDESQEQVGVPAAEAPTQSPPQEAQDSNSSSQNGSSVVVMKCHHCGSSNVAGYLDQILVCHECLASLAVPVEENPSQPSYCHNKEFNLIEPDQSSVNEIYNAPTPNNMTPYQEQQGAPPSSNGYHQNFPMNQGMTGPSSSESYNQSIGAQGNGPYLNSSDEPGTSDAYYQNSTMNQVLVNGRYPNSSRQMDGSKPPEAYHQDSMMSQEPNNDQFTNPSKAGYQNSTMYQSPVTGKSTLDSCLQSSQDYRPVTNFPDETRTSNPTYEGFNMYEAPDSRQQIASSSHMNEPTPRDAYYQSSNIYEAPESADPSDGTSRPTTSDVKYTPQVPVHSSERTDWCNTYAGYHGSYETSPDFQITDLSSQIDHDNMESQAPGDAQTTDFTSDADYQVHHHAQFTDHPTQMNTPNPSNGHHQSSNTSFVELADSSDGVSRPVTPDVQYEEIMTPEARVDDEYKPSTEGTNWLGVSGAQSSMASQENDYDDHLDFSSNGMQYNSSTTDPVHQYSMTPHAQYDTYHQDAIQLQGMNEETDSTVGMTDPDVSDAYDQDPSQSIDYLDYSDQMNEPSTSSYHAPSSSSSQDTADAPRVPSADSDLVMLCNQCGNEEHYGTVCNMSPIQHSTGMQQYEESPESNTAFSDGTALLGPCKVCGDESVGIRFQVPNCKACLSFFRRLGRTPLVPDICGRRAPCKITKRDRGCKFCRYKKCIEVGMSWKLTNLPRIRKNMGPKKGKECQVCEDQAVGFHYGAWCCGPCRRFFCSSRKLYAVKAETCQAAKKNGKDCSVVYFDVEKCRLCRYSKCLKVGMQPLLAVVEKVGEDRIENSGMPNLTSDESDYHQEGTSSDYLNNAPPLLVPEQKSVSQSRSNSQPRLVLNPQQNQNCSIIRRMLASPQRPRTAHQQDSNFQQRPQIHQQNPVQDQSPNPVYQENLVPQSQSSILLQYLISQQPPSSSKQLPICQQRRIPQPKQTIQEYLDRQRNAEQQQRLVPQTPQPQNSSEFEHSDQRQAEKPPKNRKRPAKPPAEELLQQQQQLSTEPYYPTTNTCAVCFNKFKIEDIEKSPRYELFCPSCVNFYKQAVMLELPECTNNNMCTSPFDLSQCDQCHLMKCVKMGMNMKYAAEQNEPESLAAAMFDRNRNMDDASSDGTPDQETSSAGFVDQDNFAEFHSDQEPTQNLWSIKQEIVEEGPLPNSNQIPGSNSWLQGQEGLSSPQWTNQEAYDDSNFHENPEWTNQPNMETNAPGHNGQEWEHQENMDPSSANPDPSHWSQQGDSGEESTGWRSHQDVDYTDFNNPNVGSQDITQNEQGWENQKPISHQNFVPNPQVKGGSHWANQQNMDPARDSHYNQQGVSGPIRELFKKSNQQRSPYSRAKPSSNQF